MRPLPDAPSSASTGPTQSPSMGNTPAVKISYYGKSKEAPTLPKLETQLNSFLTELLTCSVTIKGISSLGEGNRFILWSAFRVVLFQLTGEKSGISLISLWDLKSNVTAVTMLANDKVIAVTEDKEIFFLNANSTEVQKLADRTENSIPSACLALGGDAFVLGYPNGNSRVHFLDKPSIWISEFECAYAFLAGGYYGTLLDKQGTLIVIDLSSGSFRMKKSKIFNSASVCAFQRRNSNDDSFFALCDDGLIWKMSIKCTCSHPPNKITPTKELYSGMYNGRFLYMLPNEEFLWIIEKHYAYLIDVRNQVIIKEFGFNEASMEHVIECGRVIFVSLSNTSFLVLDAHNTRVKANLIEGLLVKKELKINLYTWNTGNCTPQFPSLPIGGDIIVVGLQEIIDINSASSILNATAVRERALEWTSTLRIHLQGYTLQGAEQLFGIFMAVFTRSSMDPLEGLEFSTFKTGLNGYHGNKGAVGCRFCIESTWISLAVAHLAAGESNLAERNIHANSILRGLTFSPVPARIGSLMWGGKGERLMDYHCAFFMGDLNYRVHRQSGGSSEPSRLENDELRLACMGNLHLLLRYWEEMPINFAPTYKYDPGTCTFDSSPKQRQPSWTDRILFLRGSADWMKGVKYCSTADDEPTPSDHRAVMLEGIISIR
jgi:hypothetical protein